MYTVMIKLYIHGEFHPTYPNPQHITVEFEEGGLR